jgi:hypothetical protein
MYRVAVLAMCCTDEALDTPKFVFASYSMAPSRTNDADRQDA